MKNVLTIISCALLSLLIVFGLTFFNKDDITLSANNLTNESVLDQNITSYENEHRMYYKVFEDGKLVGIISDYNRFLNMINDYYLENYATEFPNTSMTFGGDFYVTKELAYYRVNDIDNELFEYVKNSNGLGIITNVVDFSTEDGTYASIYVESMDDFNKARDTFLDYFISSYERNQLLNNETLKEMKEVGVRSIGFRVEETITSHIGVASPRKIMQSPKEILEYLCYGENDKREYYTVQDGDTLQGVGYLFGSLSAEQLMMINQNQISSTDQILTPGMVLNVTYFDSPIHVVVTKQSLKLEEIYPEQAIVIQDADLFVGNSETLQEEKNGNAYKLYEETWINGVLMSGRQISQSVIVQPIQSIIAVGASEKPNIGTGNFRWPVENAKLTCGWGCYIGHQATDIINRYNRYGDLYAADHGTVVEKSYDGISGNYIVIDHNNGFQTYYGHMLEPSKFNVGDTVMKGEKIGILGSTGKAYGVHVHFEIRVKNVKKDPCIYMNCGAIIS